MRLNGDEYRCLALKYARIMEANKMHYLSTLF